jgi:signal transduction histidine kinase
MPMNGFQRLTLARQFLVTSFPVFLVGMITIGIWVAREIERGVVNRLGAVTSLYVDSLLAPHLQHLLTTEALDMPHRTALDALLTDTPLGQKIVAFNIWRPDGRLLYSTNAAVIGQQFPVGSGLAMALSGEVYSKIIDRAELEHGFAEGDWPARLIETYAPIHSEVLGKTVGAAEFYQTTEELTRETDAAQRRSWLVVAVTMALLYLLLYGIVQRGSQTILAQRRELRDRVRELSEALARNERLDARVRGAAARTTALNERFLRRISADLHDGPGQDLGFALMRLDAVGRRASEAANRDSAHAIEDDVRAVRTGLESALADLRAISAGLQLPELDTLSTVDIAGRAIRDYERKTGARVTLDATGDALDVALPVKITLYRLLQESLANGFRHAGGIGQRVVLAHSDDQVTVHIHDEGPGFDVATSTNDGGVGLPGMRERVEALGGSFVVQAAAGHGAHITATLPTRVPGLDDA